MDGSEAVERDAQTYNQTVVDQIAAPMMREVEESATIDDLGIEFSESVRQEILAEIEQTEFSPEMREIVEDDGVLGDRGMFLWKWEHYIFSEPLTLDCVADEYEQDAYEAKTLIALYVTLIDDIGEKLDDRETFWELAKTAYPEMEPDWERAEVNDEYARSVRRVWTEFTDRIQSAPRFDEFVEPLLFNVQQSIQSMEYARLAADYPALMNPEENWYFDTQGIGLFLFWGVDLMFSPGFDPDDFRGYRQLTYELQHMWRLGNWIITWKREVREGDFSAGIFVEALDRGVVTESLLRSVENGTVNPEILIDRIEQSGLVELFIHNWKQRRDQVRERDFGIDSLDSDELVDKMEWLMQSHFATEGYR